MPFSRGPLYLLVLEWFCLGSSSTQVAVATTTLTGVSPISSVRKNPTIFCFLSPNHLYSQRVEYFGAMVYSLLLVSWARTRRWVGRGTFLRQETLSRQNSWNQPSSFSMEFQTPGWRDLGSNREPLTQQSRYSTSASRCVDPLLPAVSPSNVSRLQGHVLVCGSRWDGFRV